MTWPIGALEPDAGSRRSCHKAESPFNVRYACSGNVYDNEVDRAAKIVSVVEGLLRRARDPAGMAPGGPKHTYVHAPVVISHTRPIKALQR
jgi:hypothetical protein